MEIFDRFIKHAKLSDNKHQREAISWCLNKENQKENKGGILADEMGLGKTIVMLGLILANVQKQTLIVLPVVLINQWEEKIKNTIGHESIVFYGKQKKEITDYQLEKSYLIITSYNTLMIDSKKDKRLTNKKWDRVIFDEAHYLRNPKSKIYKHVKKLDRKITWFLTATPLQNTKQDFYSLCKLLKYKVEDILDKHEKNLVNDVMLRRTKKEVGIKFKEVSTHVDLITWTQQEEEWGQYYHDGFSFSNLRKENPSMPNHEILKQMLRAKQLCVCPSLISEIKDKVYDTSKIDAVVNKINQRKNNGNNKIIFCYFKEEIKMVKERLEECDIIAESINGKTTKKEKQRILSNTYNVLILQIKVGSEGLNLQNYNEVYFVSPSWNPYMEDQAIGRCDRIGQKKEVFVFRFVMGKIRPYEQVRDIDQGTNIELYTQSVQEKKKNMFKELVSS